MNAVELPVDGAGAFGTRIPLSLGANTLAFLAVDEATNEAVDTVTVTRNVVLPPDPETVASGITPNVASTIGSATAFLYEGANPIQTGVAPGTIDPVRVAVLKGRVLDRSAQPISGVTVSVLGHPELGQTLTRSDGQYDLAVNGGGLQNVRFQKAGYPEVQRRSQLPWQDYVVLDDVVMTPLDTAVTTIEFSDPIEIAQGTPQTDADGTRQATLMFRQGTVATMTLPNGTVDTLSSMAVRATEYTVGDDGPEAMPGALPPTTVYTYAVELSVDEAIAAGAEQVEFSQPVSFYLDNFLDMPVGRGVPIGYFDRVQGEWLAAEDGRIIEVVDIDSLGVASLNIDTIAGAEDPDTLLAHLGIDSSELAAIGSQFSIGDELWRGQHTHFSPFDYNFGARLVDGFLDIWEFLQDPYVPDWLVPEPCTRCEGSLINVEGQYLDERVPVVGTPYSLNYSSLRLPGRASSYRLEIPVFGDSIPTLLQRATLDITVGRTGPPTERTERDAAGQRG